MTDFLELRDCLTDGMQMMFFQEQTSFTIVYVKGDSNNFILFSKNIACKTSICKGKFHNMKIQIFLFENTIKISSK